MNKLILLLAFSFISRPGVAQIYFTMDSIWAPPYICQASTFDVEVFGTVSGGSVQAGSQGFLVRNDTVFARFYFVSGPGPATPYPLYRKINIPAPFNFGHYKIAAQGYYNGILQHTLTSRISICSGALATSEEIKKEPEISVFPNPATNELNIKLPTGKTDLKILLTDATGKLVWSQKIPKAAEATKISLKTFPAGIYLLQVAGGGEKFAQKIIRH